MLFFLQYRNTKFKLTGGYIKHKRNNTQMQASDQCTCATNTHTHALMMMKNGTTIESVGCITRG